MPLRPVNRITTLPPSSRPQRSSLEARFASSDPSTRRNAARKLAAFADAEAAILAQLEVEADTGVREALLSSLGHLAEQQGPSALITCLRSQEPAVRNGALEVLLQAPGLAAAAMSSLLTEPDASLRIIAIRLAEALAPQEAERLLVPVLLREQHVNVCSVAIEVLVECGTAACIDALKAAKQRFPLDEYVQFATDMVLKRLPRVTVHEAG